MATNELPLSSVWIIKYLFVRFFKATNSSLCVAEHGSAASLNLVFIKSKFSYERTSDFVCSYKTNHIGLNNLYNSVS